MAQEKGHSRAVSYQIREEWSRQREEARGAAGAFGPLKSMQLGREKPYTELGLA
jgi:hypothetical protein